MLEVKEIKIKGGLALKNARKVIVSKSKSIFKVVWCMARLKWKQQQKSNRPCCEKNQSKKVAALTRQLFYMKN